MTDLETGLKAHLTADLNLAALIAARVYPVLRPQNAVLPALSYQRISGVRVSSLAGPSYACESRIQIDCWAASYSAVKTLSRAVRKRLDGFRGSLGGVQVGSCLIDNATTCTKTTSRSIGSRPTTPSGTTRTKKWLY